ncbi:MAG: alpha-L-fucosidase [Flavobacteriaceae bacterium]|nr:alpha-L-fucosidase [Flavobacteriaceae bacterium]
MNNSKLFVLILLFFLNTKIIAQNYQPDWASIDSRPIPEWFSDAKFGIFIHWGVFSVPAWGPTNAGIYDKYAEWYWNRLMDNASPVHKNFVEFHTQTYGKDYRYQDFVRDFNCEMFEPLDWATIIKGSGAKYVVLTAKHHEGFTLWPSRESPNWNAVEAGPYRDLAGDLITAVRATGLRMGYYYSLYEWYNPLYSSDVNKYVDEHMIPQMKDLVNRYKPDILWTDGEWDHPSEVWKSTEFLAWLYNESPVKRDVVVNDRWGKETRSKHGGIYTTEYDLVHEGVMTDTPNHPWEECRGIGGSFGYNRNENLESYSTSEALVHILIDKVSRGGNLLLNIGPTADGRIPVIQQQRLKDIGDWLLVNGEAIYGTSNWAKAGLAKLPDVFYTRKDNDLYVICTRFPESALTIKGINSDKVSMLGYSGKISAKASGSVLTIEPPQVSPATSPCEFAWVFKVTNALTD